MTRLQPYRSRPRYAIGHKPATVEAWGCSLRAPIRQVHASPGPSLSQHPYSLAEHIVHLECGVSVSGKIIFDQEG